MMPRVVLQAFMCPLLEIFCISSVDIIYSVRILKVLFGVNVGRGEVKPGLPKEVLTQRLQADHRKQKR